VDTAIDVTLEPDAASEHPVRVVWALAWPAVALNSLQVVNTLLDRGFIGHLPAAALTAHGGATNIMFMMFSLAVAVSTGATALVSRA
jgi:Na+-driven multidrug efflux pump